jgi:hypothetical protein
MLEAARMTGSMQRFINVCMDELCRETSLGKEHGEQRVNQRLGCGGTRLI